MAGRRIIGILLLLLIIIAAIVLIWYIGSQKTVDEIIAFAPVGASVRAR
jgi:hypothetical protein